MTLTDTLFPYTTLFQTIEQLTPRTVTEPVHLISQLRTAQAIGYTTALDENILGVVSVGAPVRSATGMVIAAISVAYPRSVGPQVEIAEVGERVLADAARSPAGLGFAGESEPDGKGTRARKGVQTGKSVAGA